MCIFCKIIAKKQPADIVYENDKVIGFTDINPKAPVHILIVPKIHIPSMREIGEEHRDVLAEILVASEVIAEEQKIKDCHKLVFNVGRKGGQVIDHLHLHLLGGW